MAEKDLEQMIKDLKNDIDKVDFKEATPQELAQYLVKVEKLSVLMARAAKGSEVEPDR